MSPTKASKSSSDLKNTQSFKRSLDLKRKRNYKDILITAGSIVRLLDYFDRNDGLLARNDGLLARNDGLLARNDNLDHAEDFFKDPQNVHASGIVQSAKDSIDNLLSLDIYDDSTLDKIREDPDFPEEIKTYLLEQAQDPCVHSALKVTFRDVLCLVYPLLLTMPEPLEAKKIFISEVIESFNKCYHGKIIRILNSLTGLHPDIKIWYSNNIDIANTVNLLREKYADQSSEDLKIIVTRELRDRGYTEEQIQVWTEDL